MTLREFKNDEEAYHDWLRTNPRGFVVNSFKRPKPDYMQLHESRCPSIAERGPYTTGDYMKVCSDNLIELRRWARERDGSLRAECPECEPE